MNVVSLLGNDIFLFDLTFNTIRTPATHAAVDLRRLNHEQNHWEVPVKIRVVFGSGQDFGRFLWVRSDFSYVFMHLSGSGQIFIRNRLSGRCKTSIRRVESKRKWPVCGQYMIEMQRANVVLLTYLLTYLTFLSFQNVFNCSQAYADSRRVRFLRGSLVSTSTSLYISGEFGSSDTR